jgi:hypothetical protein
MKYFFIVASFVIAAYVIIALINWSQSGYIESCNNIGGQILIIGENPICIKGNKFMRLGRY